MSSLADREKRYLLEVARRALALAARERKSLEDFPEQEVFLPAGGAFVTLRLCGRLRGCIGQPESDEPLAEVVAHCTKSAALEDSRFTPVRPEELPGIEIELSVLSRLETITPGEIVIGKHGLALSAGRRRGILLPQVAVQFRWTAERFLEETCLKAGLENGAWKNPETKIQAFTAQVFGDLEFRAVRQDIAEPRKRENRDYSSST